eukprot:m.11261 g.11261  ORF g.11261 m.11261 type:complete len:101 (-) comp7617_c0_seq1:70-372(-)
MRLFSVIVVVLLISTAFAQFQFAFDDMFGGDEGFFQQGGGGGRNKEQKKQEAEEPKGYLCKTGERVEQPKDCPCPGYKMVKCDTEDWYVCLPSGSKCPTS